MDNLIQIWAIDLEEKKSYRCEFQNLPRSGDILLVEGNLFSVGQIVHAGYSSLRGSLDFATMLIISRCKEKISDYLPPWPVDVTDECKNMFYDPRAYEGQIEKSTYYHK